MMLAFQNNFMPKFSGLDLCNYSSVFDEIFSRRKLLEGPFTWSNRFLILVASQTSLMLASQKNFIKIKSFLDCFGSGFNDLAEPLISDELDAPMAHDDGFILMVVWLKPRIWTWWWWKNRVIYGPGLPLHLLNAQVAVVGK